MKHFLLCKKAGYFVKYFLLCKKAGYFVKYFLFCKNAGYFVKHFLHCKNAKDQPNHISSVTDSLYNETAVHCVVPVWTRLQSVAMQKSVHESQDATGKVTLMN